MANQTPPRRIPSPFPQFLAYSWRSPRREGGWRPPGEPRCNPPPCLGKLKLYPFLLPLLLLLLLRVAGPVICSASGGDQTWDGVVVTQADFQALQSFKQELVDPRGFLRTWNDTGYGACSGGWDGIKCAQGQVIVIQLPWIGLAGRISAQIGQLRSLRKLSLHDNLIGGSIPATVGLLPGLRGLQLFNNRLSGSVPPSLGFCRLLQTLDLSNNSLTGAIPGDLANATKLFLLNLSHNSFSGSIPAGLARSSLVFLALHHNNLSGPMPDELGNLSRLRTLDLSNNRINGSLPALGRMPALQQLDLSRNNLTGGIPPAIGDLPNLKSFSVSYNSLSGSVPVRLARQFNSSSFVGNIQLCGYSGSAPCPPPSSVAHAPATSRSIKARRRKLSTKDMILISAGTILLVLLLLCCALLYCLIRRRISASRADDVRADTASTSSVVVGASGAGSVGKGGISSGAAETSGGEAAGGILVHFEGPMVFTAEELLCATAEIMGKSTYGTVYRATLEGGGHQVAVKRLREKITKNQREFEVEVEQLGKIRHPNLLPLRAYYAGPKGEKLLVFDFMPRGSLSAFLHARGSDTPMDWRMRKNIARAAARGLLHLHSNENIVHGNLTSGNVLLDDQTDARVSDFGLSRLMTAAANVNVIATASALGYRAPELSKLRKASAKTDVYSLGVLLLELLTGKSPGGGVMNGVDLPQWVASVVEEEWTNEVFDVELMREATDIGDELLNALKLALHCVDPSPSARPEVHLVLQQLEETGTEVSGSSDDDGSVAGPSTVE